MAHFYQCCAVRIHTSQCTDGLEDRSSCCPNADVCSVTIIQFSPQWVLDLNVNHVIRHISTKYSTPDNTNTTVKGYIRWNCHLQATQFHRQGLDTCRRNVVITTTKHHHLFFPDHVEYDSIQDEPSWCW